MKKIQDIKIVEVSEVTLDPSLDKYKHMNLFPEKLAKANKMLKTAKLPHNKGVHDYLAVLRRRLRLFLLIFLL